MPNLIPSLPLFWEIYGNYICKKKKKQMMILQMAKKLKITIITETFGQRKLHNDAKFLLINLK